MSLHPTAPTPFLDPFELAKRGPLGRSRRSPGRKPKGKANGRAAESGVTLLIDDSEEDRVLLAAAFERVDAPTALRWVSSHEQAMAYFAGRPPFDDRLQNPLPSLVLLDLQLPVSDGLTILGWLRSRPEEWRRVPVVMLTTSNDHAEIRRAYDLGANSFLVKPTRFEDLCKLVATLCDYWLRDNRRA